MPEPDSIVGWVSGPDGIYEVATSGDRPIPTIPREATPARRPNEQALHAMAERLSDALQSRDWRQAEAALEEWQLLRADLERHVSSDERDRKELIAWVAEMSKREPRMAFDAAFLAKIANDMEAVASFGGDANKAEAVREIAERCARAARVTGWRERGQS